MYLSAKTGAWLLIHSSSKAGTAKKRPRKKLNFTPTLGRVLRRHQHGRENPATASGCKKIISKKPASPMKNDQHFTHVAIVTRQSEGALPGRAKVRPDRDIAKCRWLMR
jgi:hypothetical protein